MSTKFIEPNDSIRGELNSAVRRIFKTHFEASNIHPHPLSITYDLDKSEWTASVDLNWQRKSDYKCGTHVATFKYVQRETPNRRERYWYCSSGLPNDYLNDRFKVESPMDRLAIGKQLQWLAKHR